MNDMHYLDLEYPWEGHPSLRSTTFKKDPTEVSGQDVARRGQMPGDKAGPLRIGSTGHILWGQGGLGTSKGCFSTFVWEMLMVENWRKRWRKGQPRNHCDGSKVGNHHGHSTAPQPWVMGRAQPWPSSLPQSHNSLETSTLKKKKRASSTHEDNPIKWWGWDSSPGRQPDKTVGLGFQPRLRTSFSWNVQQFRWSPVSPVSSHT